MGAKKKDDRMSFAQTFVSGGIAGVASRSITSPLDVIKILAQVGTKETSGGFFKSFANLYRAEGLKAFWKGNGIACVRLFPYNAVQFAAFTYLKKMFSDADGVLTPVRALTAGSLGGIVATVATYPTDMVKTRLTIQHSGGDAKYKGMMDCFRVVLREEGMKAFFQGMSTSIVGVIPFAGGTFMAYEFLERVWGKPKHLLTPYENFLNGCAAAAFAQTFSFPFDTIRKKLQAQAKGKGGDVYYEGMIDCFSKTIKKEGIFGLWRGTTANLAKVAPYAGIMFATFEACRRVCLHWNGYTAGYLDATPIPGVPQNLKPHELKEWMEKQKK
uniref:Mitochondrial carrier family protein 1 n=1 Tax=Stygiella incarcerata TaxID=1712417 RepID=A0A192ZIU4_9EUKA|nr:mitochondrial carrier family protein 1 [Stygiella incarcerata]